MGIQESFIAFLTFSLAPTDAINIVSAAAVSAGQPHCLLLVPSVVGEVGVWGAS